MRIRTKILLLFTVGATVPLLLGNLFVVYGFSKMTERRIGEELIHTADLASSRIGDRLERTLADLANVAASVPFRELMPEDLQRAQELPYRQMPGSTLVALIDGEGKAVVPPFQPSHSLAASLHRAVPSADDLEQLSRHIPLQLARSANAAIGPAYLGGAGDPRMVIARELTRRDDNDRPWILAVELSLTEICDLSKRYGTKAATVNLVDLEGGLVCEGASPGHRMPPAILARLSAAPLLDWVRPDGRAVLATATDVPGSGWRMVIEHSKQELRRPIVEAYRLTAIWLAISLAMAVFGGMVLSREITLPITALEQGALRIASGEYDKEIGSTSTDELGRLSAAFDKMSREIRAWNAELVHRVEQRTAELREAGEQILRSQKLAAIGELGSGAAHEINNPLTSVICTAQLLESHAEPGGEVAKGLEVITANARRVADVVETLLRISQSQVSEDMRPVDLCQVVRRVAGLHATRFAEQHIELDLDLVPAFVCRVHGKGPDLELAFSQLVDNARRAMPKGGVVGFSVDIVEGGAVLVSVSDNGPGMTDDVRRRAFDPFFTTNPPGSGARGLGLSLVQRIVEEHAGRVVLESDQGRGTRVKLYFPSAARLSRA